MRRVLPLLLTLATLAPAGCTQAEPTTAPAEAGADSDDDFAGREVVDNWKAQPGDVTVCPLSGRKFEVEDDSGRYSYQGYTFVFCCSGKCLEKVEADPGKYLDDLVEQAGGPASDPDPAEGGAIDDTD